jgi:type I restriction enzyme S subunit
MAWPREKLSAIAAIGAGNSAPQNKEHFTDGKYPFVRTSDVGQIKFGRITDARDKLNDSGAQKLKLFPTGTVLFPKSGASTFLNHRVILAVDSYVSSHLATIKGNESVDDHYLLYYLAQIDARDLVQDHDYPSLRLSDLAEIEVPLPKLPEQKRIVAILDQAFADIEKTLALTEQNLKNARELFESTLQQVFSQRGEGWAKAELFDHVKFIDYRGKTPKKTDSGLRLITAKNVRMGFLRKEPQEYVAPDSYEGWMTRGIPLKGDILFTTEAPLANVAQLNTSEKVVFAQRVITMQPDRQVLHDTFLKYLLMSAPIQRRIHEKGTGATAKGIKASLLKKIPIEFPANVSQQRDIANKLDALTKHVERLEVALEEKLQKLNLLKASILLKAFSVELTKASTEAAA